MTTLDYYNQNASEYFEKTVKVDMKKQYDFFLKYMKPNGKILDFGCGSGRDSLYFKDLGYDVDAIDGSNDLCELASHYTKLNVKCMNFDDLNIINYYDGIWACATLLHVSKSEMHDILVKIRNALKKDGIVYIALKDGNKEEITSEGRFFNYYTKELFELETNKARLVPIDYMNNVSSNVKWNNFILKKGN